MSAEATQDEYFFAAYADTWWDNDSQMNDLASFQPPSSSPAAARKFPVSTSPKQHSAELREREMARCTVERMLTDFEMQRKADQCQR